MPLLFTQTLDGAVLGVWSKQETAEQLLPMIDLCDSDKAVYEQIGNDRRRTEWLASPQSATMPMVSRIWLMVTILYPFRTQRIWLR